MENEYRIECEECDTTSIILLDNGAKPEFCPCCGRRASAEDITDGDWQDI
tara:strand:- start:767 stop:916 length:150 start_codon:yes stop_codon:yes gene_type:complete